MPDRSHGASHPGSVAGGKHATFPRSTLLQQRNFYLTFSGNAGGSSPAGGQQGDTAIESAKPKLKPPSRYQVVMLNDDFTPMEFVVDVLQMFFGMPLEKASQIMLIVHTRGRAVCGVYSRDIAETKAFQVTQYAREHQHPLLCEIERVDE